MAREREGGGGEDSNFEGTCEPPFPSEDHSRIPRNFAQSLQTSAVEPTGIVGPCLREIKVCLGFIIEFPHDLLALSFVSDLILYLSQQSYLAHSRHILCFQLR
jgi:hypothetical protein